MRTEIEQEASQTEELNLNVEDIKKQQGTVEEEAPPPSEEVVVPDFLQEEKGFEKSETLQQSKIGEPYDFSKVRTPQEQEAEMQQSEARIVKAREDAKAVDTQEESKDSSTSEVGKPVPAKVDLLEQAQKTGIVPNLSSYYIKKMPEPPISSTTLKFMAESPLVRDKVIEMDKLSVSEMRARGLYTLADLHASVRSGDVFNTYPSTRNPKVLMEEYDLALQQDELELTNDTTPRILQKAVGQMAMHLPRPLNRIGTGTFKTLYNTAISAGEFVLLGTAWTSVGSTDYPLFKQAQDLIPDAIPLEGLTEHIVAVASTVFTVALSGLSYAKLATRGLSLVKGKWARRGAIAGLTAGGLTFESGVETIFNPFGDGGGSGLISLGDRLYDGDSRLAKLIISYNDYLQAYDEGSSLTELKWNTFKGRFIDNTVFVGVFGGIGLMKSGIKKATSKEPLLGIKGDKDITDSVREVPNDVSPKQGGPSKDIIDADVPKQEVLQLEAPKQEKPKEATPTQETPTQDAPTEAKTMPTDEYSKEVRAKIRKAYPDGLPTLDGKLAENMKKTVAETSGLRKQIKSVNYQQWKQDASKTALKKIADAVVEGKGKAELTSESAIESTEESLLDLVKKDPFRKKPAEVEDEGEIIYKKDLKEIEKEHNADLRVQKFKKQSEEAEAYSFDPKVNREIKKKVESGEVNPNLYEASKKKSQAQAMSINSSKEKGGEVELTQEIDEEAIKERSKRRQKLKAQREARGEDEYMFEAGLYLPKAGEIKELGKKVVTKEVIDSYVQNLKARQEGDFIKQSADLQARFEEVATEFPQITPEQEDYVGQMLHAQLMNEAGELLNEATRESAKLYQEKPTPEGLEILKQNIEDEIHAGLQMSVVTGRHFPSRPMNEITSNQAINTVNTLGGIMYKPRQKIRDELREDGKSGLKMKEGEESDHMLANWESQLDEESLERHTEEHVERKLQEQDEMSKDPVKAKKGAREKVSKEVEEVFTEVDDIVEEEEKAVERKPREGKTEQKVGTIVDDLEKELLKVEGVEASDVNEMFDETPKTGKEGEITAKPITDKQKTNIQRNVKTPLEQLRQKIQNTSSSKAQAEELRKFLEASSLSKQQQKVLTEQVDVFEEPRLIHFTAKELEVKERASRKVQEIKKQIKKQFLKEESVTKGLGQAKKLLRKSGISEQKQIVILGKLEDSEGTYVKFMETSHKPKLTKKDMMTHYRDKFRKERDAPVPATPEDIAVQSLEKLMNKGIKKMLLHPRYAEGEAKEILERIDTDPNLAGLDKESMKNIRGHLATLTKEDTSEMNNVIQGADNMIKELTEMQGTRASEKTHERFMNGFEKVKHVVLAKGEKERARREKSTAKLETKIQEMSKNLLKRPKNTRSGTDKMIQQINKLEKEIGVESQTIGEMHGLVTSLKQNLNSPYTPLNLTNEDIMSKFIGDMAKSMNKVRSELTEEQKAVAEVEEDIRKWSKELLVEPKASRSSSENLAKSINRMEKKFGLKSKEVGEMHGLRTSLEDHVKSSSTILQKTNESIMKEFDGDKVKLVDKAQEKVIEEQKAIATLEEDIKKGIASWIKAPKDAKTVAEKMAQQINKLENKLGLKSKAVGEMQGLLTSFQEQALKAPNLIRQTQESMMKEFYNMVKVKEEFRKGKIIPPSTEELGKRKLYASIKKEMGKGKGTKRLSAVNSLIKKNVADNTKAGVFVDNKGKLQDLKDQLTKEAFKGDLSPTLASQLKNLQNFSSLMYGDEGDNLMKALAPTLAEGLPAGKFDYEDILNIRDPKTRIAIAWTLLRVAGLSAKRLYPASLVSGGSSIVRNLTSGIVMTGSYAVGKSVSSIGYKAKNWLSNGQLDKAMEEAGYKSEIPTYERNYEVFGLVLSRLVQNIMIIGKKLKAGDIADFYKGEVFNRMSKVEDRDYQNTTSWAYQQKYGASDSAVVRGYAKLLYATDLLARGLTLPATLTDGFIRTAVENSEMTVQLRTIGREAGLEGEELLEYEEINKAKIYAGEDKNIGTYSEEHKIWLFKDTQMRKIQLDSANAGAEVVFNRKLDSWTKANGRQAKSWTSRVYEVREKADHMLGRFSIPVGTFALPFISTISNVAMALLEKTPIAFGLPSYTNLKRTDIDVVGGETGGGGGGYNEPPKGYSGTYGDGGKGDPKYRHMRERTRREVSAIVPLVIASVVSSFFIFRDDEEEHLLHNPIPFTSLTSDREDYQLFKASNIRPNDVVVYGRTFDLEHIKPAIAVLYFAGAIVRLAEESKDIMDSDTEQKMATAVAFVMAEFVSGTLDLAVGGENLEFIATIISNPNGMRGAISDLTGGYRKAMASITIPAGVRDILKALNKQKRRYMGGDGEVYEQEADSFIEELKVKLGSTTRPKRNIYGEKRKGTSWVNKSASVQHMELAGKMLEADFHPRMPTNKDLNATYSPEEREAFADELEKLNVAEKLLRRTEMYDFKIAEEKGWKDLMKDILSTEYERLIHQAKLALYNKSSSLKSRVDSQKYQKDKAKRRTDAEKRERKREMVASREADSTERKAEKSAGYEAFKKSGGSAKF